jgi:hypothetical protein
MMNVNVVIHHWLKQKSVHVFVRHAGSVASGREKKKIQFSYAMEEMVSP